MAELQDMIQSYLLLETKIHTSLSSRWTAKFGGIMGTELPYRFIYYC
jgi:hypothetical protein